MKVRKILTALESVFNPPMCPVCSSALEHGESIFCTRCRWEMPLTEYWLHEQNPITEKFGGQFPIERGCSLFFYNQNSRWHRPIHLMKYYGHRQIAKELGRMLGFALKNAPGWNSIDVIIPVPLHPLRRLVREYNQAEEICQGLSSQIGAAVDNRSVRRVRYSASQVGRSGEQRMTNISKSAFRVVNSHQLKGKNIVIVDDVLTTGSTISALARAILEAVPDAKISIATLAISSYNINR
ncbi:MAG: ComF family protein [Rikenellaceae bacterium]|nr:ComF family protein [Rikenellaceae bacterium]